jgi:hypothetical protein
MWNSSNDSLERQELLIPECAHPQDDTGYSEDSGITGEEERLEVDPITPAEYEAHLPRAIDEMQDQQMAHHQHRKNQRQSLMDSEESIHRHPTDHTTPPQQLQDCSPDHRNSRDQ